MDEPCSSASNMCSLPKESWAWDGPIHTSIISEFGLECSSSFIMGLPASMFFMGCLVGGFVLATLADSSLGRKNMLFFSCLIMSLSSFLATFSTNVWIYSAFKFLSGFGRATVGTASLVLVSELVAKGWRGKLGVMGFFVFSLGFLTLSPLAYVNRGFSWRNLYLWTSLPALLYCGLIYFFAHESPRWLLIRHKKEEAVEILKSITSTTHNNLNLAISSLSLEEEVWNADLYSILKIMLQKKWSSRRLLVIMAMGLGIGLVYYGMPLGLGILSFNLYLSVTFNALSEIPSTLISYILLDKFNRRSAIFLLTMVSGISSVLATMEGTIMTRLQIVFELISFSCACAACDVALIYTTELFPTPVRNFALSLARETVALGGAISPVLVAASRKHRFLCYGVFGMVIGCSGMFVVCLPETEGKTFCDSMDEQERKQELLE
uniref:Solute carrier family 22 member 3 n=2 Tax=Cajanus cajan TaxID=3821 RepID=A0A151TX71_CAJCA|nr:Solute carrier family 22 member 3 [Cajanus cajan]